jgi:outer membrane lipoprotein-sorting protein
MKAISLKIQQSFYYSVMFNFFKMNFKNIVQLFVVLLVFQTTVNAQSIDPKIKALIKRAESQMGGQKALDEINTLSWNFFNIRSLTWNKKTNDVRIDWRKENSVYIINTETKKGRILKNGIEMTQPDSLNKYLTDAYDIWINDSYWLLMPFKLDDPGVKLSYAGIMTSESIQECDVLEMTFEKVGVTPNNKYFIFIDKASGMVVQWDFFTNANDAQPRFTTPWRNYLTYGNVKLSGDRGDKQITDIHVFKRVDNSVFNTFKRPSFLN